MDTSKNTPTQDKQWTLSEHSLVSVLSENHYTPKQFVKALGAPSFTDLMRKIKPQGLPWFNALIKTKVYSHLPKLDFRFAKECGRSWLSERCWEIQTFTFSYRSLTVDNRETVLSGRVTFLNNKQEGTPHQVKTISLSAHQAFFDPDWTPSRNLMYTPLKALWDSAVIEPDQQKWGITHGIESDGSGSSVHMAQQYADCIVAALEIMRQHGVTLAPDGYTTNWGSSQGALTALFFAKWYDEEAPKWFKDTLRLKSTFSSEGAVLTKEFREYTYQHPEYIAIELTVMVSYFKAFSQEQLGGYKPEDFVPEWYLEKKYEHNGRKISFFDAISHYFPEITDPITKDLTSFEQVVAPDMLTADGKVDMDCPKMRAWLACLAKYNNPDGWVHAHPVYMVHSPEDEMIPYKEAYRLYLRISNDGKDPSVHMKDVPSVRFIPAGGLNPHFIIAFFIQLYIAFSENPEDMRLLRNSDK